MACALLNVAPPAAFMPNPCSRAELLIGRRTLSKTLSCFVRLCFERFKSSSLTFVAYSSSTHLNCYLEKLPISI